MQDTKKEEEIIAEKILREGVMDKIWLDRSDRLCQMSLPVPAGIGFAKLCEPSRRVAYIFESNGKMKLVRDYSRATKKPPDSRWKPQRTGE